MYVVAAALAACIIAAAVVIGRARRGDRAEARIGLPVPRAQSAASPTVRLADFTGAESCASCHKPQYDAWKRSTHGTAGGPPNAQVVIARFDGAPIRFKDAVVTPAARGGVYTFTVQRTGEPTQVMRVDGVIGGGHMAGGGTQGFVSRFPDGTLRFLPFDFIRQEGVWFCNTNSRTNHGYQPITAEMLLSDCGDWPPSRVIGDLTRFANCQGCHGSQIVAGFDTAAKQYDTHVQSLAVNCESCHGPGRRHIELARAGRLASSADIGMRALATLPKDSSLGVCFSCHALKDQVQPGYLPGASLAQFYSTKLALLGDRPLYADGRVRTFAYQQTHLYSACYRNGSMTCTSCHDPHSQGYRDVNGAPLATRSSDGQCTSCHASKAEPIEAHTHHPAASAGSRCVSCHMPYLQEHEVGTTLRYARADHSIPIPRPAFDERLGVQNACSRCHADRGVDALQAQTERWYGAIKPHPPIVAGLREAQAPGLDPDRIAALVLRPEPDHVVGEFAGLSYLLESVLAPDMPSLDRSTTERLEQLAGSADVDLAALALASLHFARGEQRDVRAFLRATLDTLAARDLPVRRRWVLVLGFLGDRYRERGDPAKALITYRKALEILPDDPRVLANAGQAASDAGDAAGAVASLRRSLERDPNQPLTLVNLGNALAAAGDVAGATDSYERAMRQNPREPLAYFNLGNLALQAGNAARAVDMYQQTIAIDPGMVAAHFNLARAYAAQRDAAGALAALRRGLSFDPRNDEGRQMLQSLQQAMGQR